MAIGRVNTGGGIGKLFAIISVTYPEGSVCTCSDWTKTLTAKDTSGKALFNVPAGEWTVSCTDGSRTKSVTVSITQEGQCESVTLSYTFDIYNNGIFADGFSTRTLIDSKVVNSDGVLTVSGSSGAGVAFIPAVILASYKTLEIECSYSGSGGGYDTWLCAGANQTIATENDFANGASNFPVRYFVKNDFTQQAISLDLSTISTEMYVHVLAYALNETNIKITRISLIP